MIIIIIVRTILFNNIAIFLTFILIESLISIAFVVYIISPSFVLEFSPFPFLIFVRTSSHKMTNFVTCKIYYRKFTFVFPFFSRNPSSQQCFKLIKVIIRSTTTFYLLIFLLFLRSIKG